MVHKADRSTPDPPAVDHKVVGHSTSDLVVVVDDIRLEEVPIAAAVAALGNRSLCLDPNSELGLRCC